MDDRSLIVPPHLLSKYDPKNVREALADHLTFSEAMTLVGQLLKAWPTRDGSAISDGYLGALAAVLVDYPRTVAVECCDPRHGVARETKYLPTVADLVAWCEPRTEKMRGIVDREDRRVAIQEKMRRAAWADYDLAQDRKTRLTYDELKAKYGPNWGLKAAGHREPTLEEGKKALVDKIGQEAFDAIPDIGYTLKDWQKLKAPDEWP